MQAREAFQQTQKWQDAFEQVMQDTSVGTEEERQTLSEIKELNKNLEYLLLSIAALRLDPEPLTLSNTFDEQSTDQLTRHLMLLAIVAAKKNAVMEKISTSFQEIDATVEQL